MNLYQDENRRFARQMGIAATVFAGPCVALELPGAQVDRPDSATAFLFAANLLCRLFTDLHLVAPDVPLASNPWGLCSLHAATEPLAALSEGRVVWGAPKRADIVLGIGARPTVPAAQATFVSFAGWRVALEQILESDQQGPFGALYAACIGVAQIFLHAVAAGGGHQRPMLPFSWSLLTYDNSDANSGLPAQIELPEIHLVGVGAVGSAAVYALAHVPSLTGTVHLIDNDLVDGTNLQRYVLMRREDIGRAKPAVAAGALAGRGLTLDPYERSFQQFADERGYAVNLLLTPVDSEAARRQLAMCLPRAVLNAATGDRR